MNGVRKKSYQVRSSRPQMTNISILLYLDVRFQAFNGHAYNLYSYQGYVQNKGKAGRRGSQGMRNKI